MSLFSLQHSVPSQTFLVARPRRKEKRHPWACTKSKHEQWNTRLSSRLLFITGLLYIWKKEKQAEHKRCAAVTWTQMPGGRAAPGDSWRGLQNLLVTADVPGGMGRLTKMMMSIFTPKWWIHSKSPISCSAAGTDPFHLFSFDSFRASVQTDDWAVYRYSFTPSFQIRCICLLKFEKITVSPVCSVLFGDTQQLLCGAKSFWSHDLFMLVYHRLCKLRPHFSPQLPKLAWFPFICIKKLDVLTQVSCFHH